MIIPSKTASAIELVNFINSYNQDIYDTLLEGGEYMPLIEDLIKANLYDNCYNFVNAMKAIHTNRRRYYAGARDITHEVNHVLENLTEYENLDFQHTIEDIDLLIESSQEYVIAYLEGMELEQEDKTASIKYLEMFDQLIDFPYDAKKDRARNLWDFKRHIERMEEKFLDTIECTYLPLLALTSEEKKMIKTSPDTELVEELILKIFNNWGLINKSAGKYARNLTATGKVDGVGAYKINRHLETMGIYRKQYYNFLSKTDLVASKKLTLGMALYFAPNDVESVEDFMNALGYSLKPNVMSTIEGDTGSKKYMLDSEVRRLLRSGLDTELILMLIAEKSNEVKKSASSPNFS